MSDETPPAPDRLMPQLVLVTGPSGAGRSTAIRALEDMGFEAIDNMPFSLLPRLLDGRAPPDKPLALGLDVRNHDFSTDALIALIERLDGQAGLRLGVLYLDCRPEILQQRFSETRRRHPLAPKESVEAGIAREFDLLVPVRVRADLLIDTSDMTPHDLRAELERWFTAPDGRKLAVSVHSFSYKRGLPHGLDIVLDCRFLNNPHWQPDLRGLDGRAPGVAAFVRADPRFDSFHTRVTDMVAELLPAFEAEGKSYLAIGFGCTGGQHRSVVMTESLAESLAQRDWQVSIRHRELERRGEGGIR